MARVLIIDDSPAIRSAVHVILSRAGHSVQAAVDGKEGLKSFEAEPPDLVITDVVMPRQDGIETIRRMRALNAHIPIIAISGSGNHAGLDFLHVARDAGALIGLQKPFAARDLLGAVDTSLSHGHGPG